MSDIGSAVVRCFLGLLLIAPTIQAAEISVTWQHPTQREDTSALALTDIASTTIEWGGCNDGKFPAYAAGAVTVAAPATFTTITGLPWADWCVRGYTTLTTGARSAASAAIVTPAIDSPDYPLPLTPMGLTMTAVSSRSVSLSWTDYANNEMGYSIEQDDSNGMVEVATLDANTTAHTITGLGSNGAYWFRIRAYNLAGYSNYSNVVEAYTPAPALNAPGSVVAQVVSDTQINLSWVDNSADESSFKIELSTDGTTFVQIAEPGADTTMYSVTGLSEVTPYWFRVRAHAIAADDNSDYSNTVFAMTSTREPYTFF